MTVPVSASELRRRTIHRADWVPCPAAFIDCRNPGSDRKDNYSFIGIGVSQNAEQFINLEESHGFQTGAAGMPHGTTNSLHLHFTAEVFLNFGGEYRIRWGATGTDGEYLSSDGDIISVPTWIFRGFTNEGADDGVLLTVLGHDDTGGIIWAPSVLREAEQHGLCLTAANELLEIVPGGPPPEGVEIVTPVGPEWIDQLERWTVPQMAGRVSSARDRVFSDRALLCTAVDGGHAALCPVLGYGMTENRRQAPLLPEPHHFNLAVLRATPGQGVLRYRQDESQVLIARTGVWEVTVNDADESRSVRLSAADQVSVPVGCWRSARLISAPEGGETAELVIVNGGDGRVRMDWASEVVSAAGEAGWVIDPNGYLAPSANLPRSALPRSASGG